MGVHTAKTQTMLVWEWVRKRKKRNLIPVSPCWRIQLFLSLFFPLFFFYFHFPEYVRVAVNEWVSRGWLGGNMKKKKNIQTQKSNKKLSWMWLPRTFISFLLHPAEPIAWGFIWKWVQLKMCFHPFWVRWVKNETFREKKKKKKGCRFS